MWSGEIKEEDDLQSFKSRGMKTENEMGKMLESKQKVVGEEGDKEEEEGEESHLVWAVHKGLAVPSHKIC